VSESPVCLVSHFGSCECRRVLFAWCLILGAVSAGESCLLGVLFWEL
jgi:hypothetical protein